MTERKTLARPNKAPTLKRTKPHMWEQTLQLFRRIQAKEEQKLGIPVPLIQVFHKSALKIDRDGL